MIHYEPGHVVLVPFPFTDLTATKQRPALVVSSTSFNQSHPDIIVLAITSQQTTTLTPDEFFLSEKEQSDAGLPKPSKVKTEKIITIDKNLIRKTLGQISQNTLTFIVQLVIRNLATGEENGKQ